MNRLRKLLNGNVAILIAISFFTGFVFWYGIEKTFLRNDLGIGAQGISAIVTTYIIVSLILDVPAGVLADKWSRKYTMLLSIIFFIIADVILGISPSFIIYLLGTIFWGLFTVCMYGTNESITYDTLVEQNREKDYRKIDAYQRMMFMVGIFISSATSGILANIYDFRLTYYLSAVPLLVALYLVLKLKEPAIHKPEKRVSIFQHTGTTFKTLFSRSILVKLTAMTALVVVIENGLYEYSQYYYLALFGSVAVAALMNGLGGLLLAVGFQISPKVLRFQPIFVILGLLMFIAGSWKSPWAIVFFFSLYPLASIIENGAQAAVQHNTPSEIRASLTSAINFIGNCLVIPFTITFAYVVDRHSINYAYQLAGILFLCLGVFFIFDQIHKSNEITEPSKLVNEFTAK